VGRLPGIGSRVVPKGEKGLAVLEVVERGEAFSGAHISHVMESSVFERESSVFDRSDAEMDLASDIMLYESLVSDECRDDCAVDVLL